VPELPDVELFKRQLDSTSLHQTIASVTVNDRRILADISPIQLTARLKGNEFQSSRRHGKHLLVALDEGGWLTMHFGMTGRLQHFHDMADDPPFDRVRFDFDNGWHLAYVNVRMLGRVGLAEDADGFIASQALGPDALDRRFDLEAFKAALEGRRRDVKSALMDQSIMAGVGNIYSDEILFQAGIHPKTRVSDLEAQRLEELFRQTKAVLRTAIARRAGSEQFLDRLPSDYLLPHRERGGRCSRCGGEIQTLRALGRTAYFCARCQSYGAPRGREK
jgi:formamidopyrimidine-DNA glycosylase